MGMRMTEKQVREKLKEVIDPELGVNIVDLGLVYKTEVREVSKVQKVHVLMTLTSPGCPLAGMFDGLVKGAVEEIEGVDRKNIEVELTFDPPWTSELMSKEVKAELGYD